MGGRGIDHVGVAVRDLMAARAAFADTLGFLATQSARLPTGLEHVTIWFSDTTYLELLTYYDREKAAEIVDILERYEGGIFLGLHVGSAERAAEFLRSRGFDVEGPVSSTASLEGTGKTPVEMWRHVTFRRPAVPANAIFFIAYNQELREEVTRAYPEFNPLNFTSHGNGATGIRSVWMAVRDLAAASAAYEGVGLAGGRQLDVPYLGAVAREIAAGKGEILLLAPARADGQVAGFLQQRGQGVMGVSLEVRELEAARQALADGTGWTFTAYDGVYGPSILVPPELSHGLWIEMVETRPTSE